MVLHWRLERADRGDLALVGAGVKPRLRTDLERELRGPDPQASQVRGLLLGSGLGEVRIG